MMPGVNPRQVQQMMKQMGMSQEDIDAVKVTIETPTKILVCANPSVQKITMKGEATYQLSGNFVEQVAVAKIEISVSDIEMVSEQAGVSKDDAKKALEEANGDIAQAIVNLSN